MRQLFSILPPRMVSRKWTCQLSSGHTLPMAAAMPPWARTWWRLPSSDLHTRPTDAPWAAASMAARRPAPPAPMTRTSCSWVSYAVLAILKDDPQVPDHSHRNEPDIKICQSDAEQREPGEGRVPLVEPGEEEPDPVPRLRTRHTRGGRSGTRTCSRPAR